MKIGILTFPNSTSYGATLQMYALFRTVSELGHDAEVINYHNAFMKDNRHTARGKGTTPLSYVKFFARSVLHARLERRFRSFEKKSMKLYPSKPFSDKSKLKFADERYGAIICGSDQVWNPNITNRDTSYFLDFCTDATRRISYAPSFGVEKLDEDYRETVARELDKFNSISVREEAGRSIVSDITSRDSEVVIDPTMLLCADDWQKLEKKYSLASGEYILYYTVRTSKTLLQYCKSLSEKTGLKVVIVGGNQIIKMKNKSSMIDYAIDTSPEEWLSLIHGAKYVVTNSFHGTAFSIIYRKDFYLELPTAAPSRLLNLTRILGLEDRIVSGTSCENVSSCDYNKTDAVLPKLREASKKYLKTALQEE